MPLLQALFEPCSRCTLYPPLPASPRRDAAAIGGIVKLQAYFKTVRYSDVDIDI